MADAVVWLEPKPLGHELGRLLEAAFLAVEVGPPEQRGGIGRTRDAGDRLPDARQQPH